MISIRIMPFSILSHQAPGLALKVKFPKKFDGVALCFGTLIPDFNFLIDFFFPVFFYRFTHSIIGQIFWTIPLTILLSFIFSKNLAPFFSKISERQGKLFQLLRHFGIDQWKYLKNKNYDKRYWIIAGYSAFIGGITHVLLDLFSHANVYILFPWISSPNFSFLFYSLLNYGMISIGPFTFEANLTIYSLLWFGESVIFLLISLWYLRFIKKHDLIRIWFDKPMI